MKDTFIFDSTRKEQIRLLSPAIATGDVNATSRQNELIAQGNPRDFLQKDGLEWLFIHGYAIRDPQEKEDLVVHLYADPRLLPSEIFPSLTIKVD